MDLETFADIIQKTAATFALVVGAIWVLMNYVRNRTHVPRLQIDLKASIVERGSRRYLLANIQVKNPGLSVIMLPEAKEPGSGPHGSGLLVSRLVAEQAVPDVVRCRWQTAGAFEVLVHHESIEPGLTINEEKLLRLPDDQCDAFWLRLRVSAHGESWSADAIAVAAEKTQDPVK
jgi:hypothetical protein